MGTLNLYDSIESPQTTGQPIPSEILTGPAVAAYIAGNSWPTYPIYAKARPDLAGTGRLVSVTLTAFARARCGDFEPGGISNSEAMTFWRNADTTHGLPWVYTYASNVQALINALTSEGIGRGGYYLWSAHPSGGRHICGPNAYGAGKGCGYPQADGTQYGQIDGCDISIINDYMVGDPAPTPEPPPTTEEIMDRAMACNWNNQLHVFVVGAQGGRIWFTWQTGTAWSGGQPGAHVADLQSFAIAPTGLTFTSVAASQNGSGDLNVTATLSDHSSVYCYQLNGQNAWSHGYGQMDAFCPPPGQ